MSEEFKPIESQEELDGIIRERLKRERDSAQKRYEGWVSPEDHAKALEDANKALEDFKKSSESDKQMIADLTAQNKAYETASLKSRIAYEVGLSHEWIGRISGDNEKSIREDAESLKALVGADKKPLPTKNTESGQATDPTTASFKSLLNNIKTN